MSSLKIFLTYYQLRTKQNQLYRFMEGKWPLPRLLLFGNMPQFLLRSGHFCEGREFDLQTMFHLRLFYIEIAIMIDTQNICSVSRLIR